MKTDDRDPNVIRQRKEAFHRLFRFCNSYLVEKDSDTKQYLINQRKIKEDTLNTFQIGALPSGEDLTRLISYVGVSNLYLAGIATKIDGKLELKFKHHPLLLPIFDQNQEPIGLIGRTLYSDEKQKSLGISKYWNTSFKKSRNLYGIHVAKPHIISNDEVVIVEGNFDVITAYQANRKNVVAVSNASLSQHQVVICARYTSNIKLLFDNDEAGKMAGLSAMTKYGSIDTLNIEIKKVPAPYKDADEYLRDST